MVKNTIKNGKSCCSTVICTKLSAFDMQFYLIKKTCVKDRGDTSNRLLEGGIYSPPGPNLFHKVWNSATADVLSYLLEFLSGFG